MRVIIPPCSTKLFCTGKRPMGRKQFWDFWWHLGLQCSFHIHTSKCETLSSSSVLGTKRIVNYISQKSDGFITPQSYVRPLTVWCHSKWHATPHYSWTYLRGCKNFAFKSSQWNPAPWHKKKRIGITIEFPRNLNLKVSTDLAESKRSGSRMPSSCQFLHPPVLLWPSTCMYGA